MKFHLLLSPEAERCIEEQLHWYEEDAKRGGTTLANRWLNRLEIALQNLADEPHRHGLAPENGRWMSNLVIRQVRLNPWKTRSAWRILFTVDENHRTVTVLQIRHASRRFLHQE